MKKNKQMDMFYSILKKRQKHYDEATERIRNSDDPMGDIKVAQIDIKVGELTSIIWTMESLMEEY